MFQKAFYTLIFCTFIVNGAFAQTVAKIGKKEISLAEFRRKYQEIRKQTINPPTPAVFLEDLVRYEVGVQEAEKLKLRSKPLVADQINQVLYRFLIEEAIGKRVDAIKVNEKEMRSYYKKNPELRLSHILIEFSPGATEKQKAAAKKRALEILKEVTKSKRPFEELVRLYTDDTLTKASGGDLGYQSRVTPVPTIYSAGLKLRVGRIKGLIRSQYGYHIIKLTGKRAYEQANKRQLRQAVFDQKRSQLFDRYFKKLKSKYKISTNVKAVKNIK